MNIDDLIPVCLECRVDEMVSIENKLSCFECDSGEHIAYIKKSDYMNEWLHGDYEIGFWCDICNVPIEDERRACSECKDYDGITEVKIPVLNFDRVDKYKVFIDNSKEVFK